MENNSDSAMVEVGVRSTEKIQLGLDDMNSDVLFEIFDNIAFCDLLQLKNTLEQIWRDFTDQKIAAGARGRKVVGKITTKELCDEDKSRRSRNLVCRVGNSIHLVN